MNEEVRRAISLIPAELLRLAAGSAEVRAAIGQIMQLPAATLRAMQSPAVLDAIARLQAGARVIRLRDNAEGARALAAALRYNTTLTVLDLYGNDIGDEGAQALAAALMNNATLTTLPLDGNNIGDEGAQALAAALMNNATLTTLHLGENNIGDEGAQALATALTRNATLKALRLYENGIGHEGARALAAALTNNATLLSLNLRDNNIGEEGARALAAALDTNRTLLYLCPLGDNELDAVKDDRLHLNRIIDRMPDWVASAVARLWDPKFRIPPDLAARAAVLAFGEELLNKDGRWRSPGGRKFAAVYLMPRAEAALEVALQAELARGLL
jgi:hypothetical protein